MTRKERFYRTVERQDVDRPASWLGMPTPPAMPGLFRFFSVADMPSLKRRLGDDVWPVDVPYNFPPANHIACAFDFARAEDLRYEERTLTTPGFFADVDDPAMVDQFDWPNPSDHMNATDCRRAVESAPVEYAAMAVLWSAHFQDACAAFGMESALVTMLSAPAVFDAVIERITEFYLAANRMFLDAAAHRLDAVLIGNDLGSQSGLIISPQQVRRFVLPGTRRIVEQAKTYGLKVVHHACGATREIIPDWIEMGVDVLHPMQPLAFGMDPEGLARDFGHRVSFCGGVDAQHLLVHGSADDVRAAVRSLRKLFPTGLIVSPSHEAILPDTRPENIAALFDALNNDG